MYRYPKRGLCTVTQTAPFSNWLPQEAFTQAVQALPLVSIDLCITNAQHALLLGLRNNAPAQGYWFTPGGRIRKVEAFANAFQRIASEELGLPQLTLQLAQLMGVWDHFYDHSAYSTTVHTHYVNLPHWVQLADGAAPNVANLPAGKQAQHAEWIWMPLSEAAAHPQVHSNVQAYARWLHSRATQMG